jgi:arylformamidase
MAGAVKSKNVTLIGEGWLDISLPLKNGMVHWPEDPPLRVSRAHDMEKGDASNLTDLSLSAHTGTHIDAPLHFLKEGAGIDELPFGAVVGIARVIEIEDKHSIRREELEKHGLSCGERILFKTRNSLRCYKTDAFVPDYVFLEPEAARYLVSRGVRTVGIDYLSIDGYSSGGREAHGALLSANIWIIEG